MAEANTPDAAHRSSRSVALMPFVYGDATVRTLVIDGEPWFVLADLCRVLGLGTTARVRERLDEGVTQAHTLPTAGGPQQVTIVSEPGMYEVVIRSDKPEAVSFRRWIVGTVLPEIRRTGRFNAPNPVAASLPDRKALARMVIEAEEARELAEAKNLELAAKVEADAPKVNYVDTFVADRDLLKFRSVAASLAMRESDLRALLLSKRWIYVEESTRWSETRQQCERIRRYSAHADKRHYFRPVKRHEAPLFKGEVMHTLKITPAGAEAIARLVERSVAA